MQRRSGRLTRRRLCLQPTYPRVETRDPLRIPLDLVVSEDYYIVSKPHSNKTHP